MTTGDLISRLEEQLGKSWSSIRASRERTRAKRAQLAAALAQHGATDAALVVFGSLGRGECTSQSDIDWTLLVDGPADPLQLDVASKIRAVLKGEGVKAPNGGGPFGTLSSSFELVHRIGGDTDTNRITTQRVLLLLESAPLRESDRLLHHRIVSSVLSSYLNQSSGTRGRTGVPHFLLNDVVRYWRTMAVDYSAKRRERDDQGWALRRLKLRTSRKLIFAAGLVMCLDYHVRVVGEDALRTEPNRAALLENLVLHVGRTPLETLAYVALEHPDLASPAGAVLDAYDRFLGLLDDEGGRKALEALSRDDAGTSEELVHAEAIGDEFGSAIEAFFFGSVYKLAIRKYGVF